MPRWLLISLILSQLFITCFAVLAAVILYFLFQQKQKQYVAEKRQKKYIIEEYEKLETNQKQASSNIVKEDWAQRQKLNSLQQEVVKLQEKILSLRKEKEELELRCKEIADSRDFFSKELDTLRNNSSNCLEATSSAREDNLAFEKFTSSPMFSNVSTHFTESQRVVASSQAAESISEDSSDSECEYDFILKKDSHSKNETTEREMGEPTTHFINNNES
ncbi:hypothetical protein GAYE_SCF09G3227 [Galdieria yellowstonensis]|uniref:Uncharacterized protein n=1 Tax=Galdieria yellowstonensis TaxID=3028027 RepID=A0AAV9ID77_9RHOD|nr:hypothetical protein GAYE_SCF09G3227 [Galdieria yellowstonensis]